MTDQKTKTFDLPVVTITKRQDHQDGHDDERVLTFTASTDDVDRSGDVVHQDGWVLDRFKEKGGPFLWNHDKSQPPLGRVVRTGFDADGNLEADVRFASKQANPMGDQVYHLYKEGIMTDVSVGFLPEDAKPKRDTNGMEYEKQELMELSATPIGDNPEATIQRAYGVSKEAGEAAVSLVAKSFEESSEVNKDKDDDKDEKTVEDRLEEIEQRIGQLEEEHEELMSYDDDDDKDDKSSTEGNPETKSSTQDDDTIIIPSSIFPDSEDPTEYEWKSEDSEDDVVIMLTEE